jgi:hypothetical protein
VSGRPRRATARGRRARWAAALVAGTCVIAVPASAGAAATYQLTVTPSSITFADANPSTTPVIAAGATVSVGLKVTGASPTEPWTVGVLANGDLVSGGHTIPIDNISWTVAGPTDGTCQRPCACSAGTLSRVTGRTIFSGAGNTGSAPLCHQTYQLVNSWSYAIGSYTQTVTITVTSP